MGVIGLYRFEGDLASQIIASAGAGKFRFQTIEDLAHLTRVAEGEPLEALAIGPLCDEPLQAGRNVHSLRPDVPLVFCLPFEQCEEVRRELQFAPQLPDDVSCVPSDSLHLLVLEVLSAAVRCRNRRQDRSLLMAQGTGPSESFEKPSQELVYLDRLMELAPIGVVALDRSASVLSSNARALEILGVDSDVAIGKALYEQFDTASGCEISRLMGRVLNSGAEAKTLLERLLPADRKQYLDLSAVQFRSAAGDQRVLLVFQDVTGRIEGDKARAEALRVRAEVLDRERKGRFDNERLATELLYANALLDTLFTKAPVGFGFWDRKLRFVRVNQALAEMNGLPVHEHLGRTVGELLPNMDPGVMTSLAKVVATGEPLLDQQAAGRTPAEPDRVREWNVSYYPIRLGSEVVGVGAVCAENTERKQADRDRAELQEKAEQHHLETERALDELRRVNTELEEFAYVASHDLQEPLRTIGSYAQLLVRDYRDRLDPAADEIVNRMVEGVGRMRSLIQDLLTYSLVDRETQAPNERVDLDGIFEGVVRSLGSAVEDAAAVITHDPLPAIPSGDRRQLARLFHNLLCNSLKYRRTETALKIHAGVRREGDFWTICVRDNGEGFDARYAERIFGIFKRLHGHEVEGTGIGLALCRKIVERHGGHIRAEGLSGSGATFTFTLPA